MGVSDQIFPKFSFLGNAERVVPGSVRVLCLTPWRLRHNGQSVSPSVQIKCAQHLEPSLLGIICTCARVAEREKPFVGGVCAGFAARDGLFSSDCVLSMCLDNPWGCS